MSETSGGQKNLHAGLKSVESAEHTPARRGTKDRPLLVRCMLVFLLYIALINTAVSYEISSKCTGRVKGTNTEPSWDVL